MRTLLALAAASLLVVSPALAQEDIIKLQPGQTLITLSATERSELDQDLLVASLRMEVEDGTPQKVQERINAAMTKALSAAKKVRDAKVSTGQYYVYQHERQPPATPVPAAKNGEEAAARTVLWRGAQSLEIQGVNAAEILEAVGAIQKLGFSMSGLSYTLSPEKADAARDSLMERALASLQARAQRAAKALGKGKAEIIEVNIDGNMPYPVRAVMMQAAGRAEFADAKMAPPVAEAGATEVTLTVNARVLLK